MSEATSSPKPAPPKKASKPKKAKGVAANQGPNTAAMVIAAVKALNERGGSSLQAIKKYIAANYSVDVEKRSTYIRKALRAAVEKGSLLQTKGKGASGSFKLGTQKSADKKPVAKKAVVKKPPAKKAPAKKSTPKKKPVAKKAKVTKSPAKKAAKAKTPTKKPKKATPKKKVAPKKK